MKTSNKYEYYKVIQQNWGNGWDDVDQYWSNSKGELLNPADIRAFKDNLKAYRLNQPVPTRVVFRKELKTVNNTFKT